MRVDGNQGSIPSIEPNSYGNWQEQPDFAEPLLKLEGSAGRWNFREDDSDYYTQPGKLFRLMKPGQQKALFENTARDIGPAPREIKIKHIANCLKADKTYGEGVADALGIKLSEVPK
jgi:catalase